MRCEVARDDDSVVSIIDIGEQVPRPDRRGADAQANAPVVRALRVGDQPDAVAQLVERPDVVTAHAANAHAVDAADLHVHAHGEPGKDHELVRRIPAFDVKRRIGLRKAPGLRIGERGVERQLAGAHLREDHVRGAVDDAVERRDAIAEETRTQQRDDR